MSESCSTCNLEKVCAYPYKPTDCFDQRKFRQMPATERRPACLDSTNPLKTMLCTTCRGAGIVLLKKD